MTAAVTAPTSNGDTAASIPGIGAGSGELQLQAINAGQIAGVVLDVMDLATTRAFYELIFRDSGGRWSEAPDGLAFTTGTQTVEFVRRAHPRTLSDSGQHTAYRVPRGRVEALALQLERAGHKVEWWREDHPSERQLSPYLTDPSGNWVQLVPSDGGGPLIDHMGIEVHHHDYAESVYTRAIGGIVDYYYGWRVEEQREAKAWAGGDDPCAPWTRRDNPGWNDFASNPGAGKDLRVPRPNTQLFVRYGDTRLNLISATKVRQEPPEETLRGTPRIVFRTDQTASRAAAHLAATMPLRFRRDGAQIFVRDPDGNFVELRCAPSRGGGQ